MIPLEDLDHYEILEVRRGATTEEIERAYRMARSCYADDSLALYSLFDLADATIICDRIDFAFRVLSDRELRHIYDTRMAAEREQLLDRLAEDTSTRPAAPPGKLSGDVVAFDEVEEEREQTGEFDGARLRRTRVQRGIEIERIAAVTKISGHYLRCVEEESYSELPSAVYVRGFVTAYSRAIGLDPAKVVGSYMARLPAAGDTRSGGGRSGAGAIR